jgi:hypothetical protein
MPTLSNEIPSKNYLKILELASVISHKKIQPYLIGVKKILDFGAGEGSLTFLLKSTITDVYAYEPSSVLRTALSERLGVNVVENLAELSSEKFDLVIMCSVVQYIDPTQLTSELDQILSLTDRVIIADVPDNVKYLDALSSLISVLFEKKIELCIRLLLFYAMLVVSNSGNSNKYKHNTRYFKKYCTLRRLNIVKIKNIGLSNLRASYLIEKLND